MTKKEKQERTDKITSFLRAALKTIDIKFEESEEEQQTYFCFKITKDELSINVTMCAFYDSIFIDCLYPPSMIYKNPVQAINLQIALGIANYNFTESGFYLHKELHCPAFKKTQYFPETWDNAIKEFLDLLYYMYASTKATIIEAAPMFTEALEMDKLGYADFFGFTIKDDKDDKSIRSKIEKKKYS